MTSIIFNRIIPPSQARAQPLCYNMTPCNIPLPVRFMAPHAQERNSSVHCTVYSQISSTCGSQRNCRAPFPNSTCHNLHYQYEQPKPSQTYKALARVPQLGTLHLTWHANKLKEPVTTLITTIVPAPLAPAVQTVATHQSKPVQHYFATLRDKASSYDAVSNTDDHLECRCNISKSPVW